MLSVEASSGTEYWIDAKNHEPSLPTKGMLGESGISTDVFSAMWLT